MKKGLKITLIVVACVLVVVLSVGIPLAVKMFKKPNIVDPEIDAGQLVNAKGEVTVGITEELGSGKDLVIKDYIPTITDDVTVVSKNEDIATIKVGELGIVLEIKKAGTFEIEITDAQGNKTTETITIKEATEVSTFAEFKAAVVAKKDIVLRNDIILEEQIELFSDISGNGHTINGQNICNDNYVAAISIKEKDVVIRDTNFTNYIIPTGRPLRLPSLEKKGFIISCDGNAEFRPSLKIINCILENANRHITMNAADVTINNTIIRNAGDSTLSIESNNEGTTNLTLEDVIMANSVVSCLTNWCTSEISDATNYPNITVKGYLDIYNWKETSNARIVPDAEGVVATAGNNALNSVLESGDFDAQLYNYKDKKYIHCAMLIICTNMNGKNIPVITGLEERGYSRQALPLDFPIVKEIIKTCDLVGFATNPAIMPDAKMEDSEHYKNR